MIETNKQLNELSEDELNEVAGGGLYTKKGYLRTTASYSCEHFACRVCGKKDAHDHDELGFDGSGISIQVRCKDCQWHKALLCTNTLNKRS